MRAWWGIRPWPAKAAAAAVVSRRTGSLIPGIAFGAALALVAAPGFAGPLDGIWDLDSGFGKQPNGITFVNALHAGYVALSKTRTNDYDWNHGERWNHKSTVTGNRTPVEPDSTLDWELEPGQQQELYAALFRLRDAFVRGAREVNPVPAATAQVSYDCWIEAASEGRKEDAESCRKAFEDAMAQIDANYGPAPFEVQVQPAAPQPVAAAAPPPPQSYKVYFYFDRARWTPEGQQQLDQAIQAALADPNAAVTLVAHADRAGSVPYNQRLSERRGNAVIKAMEAAGIPRARVTMTAVGETQPLVPTPDGVPEQGNRVVEVNYAR